MQFVDSFSLSKPLIYNQVFQDVDELATSLNKQRFFCLTQLQPYPAQYHFCHVDFGLAQFLRTASCHPLQVTGDKSEEFIEFAVLLNPAASNVISHHISLNQDHLFAFDLHREADLILPANFDITTFRFQIDYFQDCLEAMNRLDIDYSLFKRNYLFLPQTLPSIHAYLRNFFKLVKNTPHLLVDHQFTKLILEDFLPLLIIAIPQQIESNSQSVPLHFRRQLVREVREYMIENLDQPITLKDLCQRLYTSSRTISYGFEEVFGISPMLYLKILRLHSVRRALKSANPTEETVMKIANRSGFWSMGHFTRDYKTFFGELPSETLNQINN
ncbi:MAG: helix-turn-helix domain-containing protein [Snowella sp.]|nr:helix-turn-helix domain-containing protein [Snowella sp.]